MKKLTCLCVFLLPVMAFAQEGILNEPEWVNQQLTLQRDLTQLHQKSKPANEVSQSTLYQAQAVVSVYKDGTIHRTCDGLVLNYTGRIAVEKYCMEDVATLENPLVKIHVKLSNMTKEDTAFQPLVFTTEAIATEGKGKNSGLEILFPATKLDEQVKAGLNKTFPVINEKTNERLSIPLDLAFRTLHHKPKVPTKTWGICSVEPCNEPAADQA